MSACRVGYGFSDAHARRAGACGGRGATAAGARPEQWSGREDSSINGAARAAVGAQGASGGQTAP